MKAAEWIDCVKAAHGWESDYRAAKELGLTRQVVSKYRSNTSSTMDDEAAVKVAAALGTPPEAVLLDQTMERTKNDEARTALAGLLKRLGWTAAAPAAQGRKSKGLYIMSTKGHSLAGTFQAIADALAPTARLAFA